MLILENGSIELSTYTAVRVKINGGRPGGGLKPPWKRVAPTGND